MSSIGETLPGLVNKLMDPTHLLDYATHELNLAVKIADREENGKAWLYVEIYVPTGVVIDGKATDVMNFKITGDLEGNYKMVRHYLVIQAAAYLKLLEPQIRSGEITSAPTLGSSVH